MTHAVKNASKRSADFLMLVYFLVVVIGVGFVLGFLTGPDAWYANLVKPSFNPPNAVFAPVWTILYIMIAVAGWLIWRVAPRSIAMGIWALQMALNWLWSPVFFVAHQPGTALVIITLLLVTVLLFIIQAQKFDKIASRLFIPYAVWIGFATILNAAIFWLNQPMS
ncbi:TspO/MBR family protein [Serratia sp. UGAL515B_01]|uniref:TspO/MBR family protein n=1 Tax=Serratia sp. UGAL515B_01 TaxID=2986763 RepID=UPI002953BFA2|nr:TspO/MBR family protein [Serratia sp. UGAL515B_01]WON76255.1 tryptophan-rich sensory protein [Serratia sp. UGAL515B_01]